MNTKQAEKIITRQIESGKLLSDDNLLHAYSVAIAQQESSYSLKESKEVYANRERRVIAMRAEIMARMAGYRFGVKVDGTDD